MGVATTQNNQVQNNQESPPVRVVFYCKDCEKIVPGIKVGRKYVYKCPLCHTKNVAFGTEKSIRSFYHVEGQAASK